MLVDTSVWIDHFRRRSERLAALLEQGTVVCHPFVIGELACGNLSRREEILSRLSRLPSAGVVTHGEALAFLDRHRLWGKGIGWIDVHLLAATKLTGTRLWTLDKSLRTVAGELGLVDSR